MKKIKIIITADNYKQCVVVPISNSRIISLYHQCDDTPETLDCVEKITEAVSELCDIMSDPKTVQIEET